MNIVRLPLAGLAKIELQSHQDPRGVFAEIFRQDCFVEWGLRDPFVQENESRSSRGILRGLHWQEAPFAQAKLVRVVSGSVFDVAVDIRRESPTFGRHHAEVLSGNRFEWLYVPTGFAHGFLSLEENSVVQYKVTALYSPTHERGIVWNDPDLGIAWPDVSFLPSLSEKDKKHPRLKDAVLKSESGAA